MKIFELMKGKYGEGNILNEMSGLVKTLPEQSFGKGTAVYSDDSGVLDVPEEVNGYIFKRGEVSVVVEMDDRTIDTIYVNSDVHEIVDEVVSTLILVEADKDLYGLSSASGIEEYIKEKKSSEESIVNDLSIQFMNEAFDPFMIEKKSNLDVVFMNDIVSDIFPNIEVEDDFFSDDEEEDEESNEDINENESEEESGNDDDANESQGEFDNEQDELDPEKIREKINGYLEGNTIESLSKKSGVSGPAITNFRKGKTKGRKSTLEKLDAVLTGEPLSVQKNEKVVNFDFEKIKKDRPKFFDDNWVRPYLETFGLNEKMIESVIKFRKLERDRLLKKPQNILNVEPKAVFAGHGPYMEKAISSQLVDSPLIVKGETGAGKTTLIQTLSCLLNIGLRTINGNNESNVETFAGAKTVENGSIGFRYGRMAQAMIEGEMIYIDEINMSRGNIIALINGVLDHRREMNIDENGEKIKGHKSLRIVAAMNEDYEDTRPLNEALRGRVVGMQMGYLTTEMLKTVLRGFDPGYTDFQREVLEIDQVSERDMRKLVQIFERLQDAAHKEEIPPEMVNPRHIIELMKLTRILSFDKAIDMLLDVYPKEDRDAMVDVIQGLGFTGISSATDVLEK